MKLANIAKIVSETATAPRVDASQGWMPKSDLPTKVAPATEQSRAGDDANSGQTACLSKHQTVDGAARGAQSHAHANLARPLVH